MPRKRKDPGWKWAEDVVAGKVVAGELTLAACKRALRDREHAGKRGWEYDQDKADRIVKFFHRYLILSGGKHDGQPFVLLPWQEFVVRQLYGWVNAKTRLRRFRFAYIETAKGSGKSPMVAGLGLHSIVADREAGAQSFVIAKNADQADVTFSSCVNFIKANPILRQRLRLWGGSKPSRIIDRSGSYIQRTTSSTEGRGRSGYIPHMVIVDEYHEHTSSKQKDIYSLGTKNRSQPLVIIITNAGTSMQSPCGNEHEMACAVARGELDDDEYFAIIFACDKDDKPMEDETCWPKANPSLPRIPGYGYIRTQIRQARGIPIKRSLVERLNFCRWLDSSEPWIDIDLWDAAQVDSLPDDVSEHPCYMGLDLSLNRDLSAAVLVWDAGETIYAKAKIWTPQQTLLEREEHDRQPYSKWVEDGFVVATPGPVVDYSIVAEWIGEAFQENDLKLIAHDPWGMRYLVREFQRQGIPIYENDPKGVRLIKHAQGFRDGWFNEKEKALDPKRDTYSFYTPSSVGYTEEALLKECLVVERNPCLRNAVLGLKVDMDAAGNRKFNKKNSKVKIDPAVALMFGVGAAMEVRATDALQNHHYEGDGSDLVLAL